MATVIIRSQHARLFISCRSKNVNYKSKSDSIEELKNTELNWSMSKHNQQSAVRIHWTFGIKSGTRNNIFNFKIKFMNLGLEVVSIDKDCPCRFFTEK